MPSLKSFHRVDSSDPEAIRQLVEAGKRRGVIKAATAPAEAGKFDAESFREIAKNAKASGALREAVSVHNPAPIEKSGADVTMPEAGVYSRWMDIDPGLAAHWLQNNFVNRPLTEDTVKSYARDMVNGVWVPTHQGIAFNDLDHLIDGQHRLSGIVMAGIPVRMMVTFGLPSKISGSKMTTMDAVDRGRTRSVADQLKIQHGMKNGSAIAMICASIACLCRNDKTRRLSVGQTLEIYDAFRPSIDWVIEFRSREPGLKAKGVLAACAFAVAANIKLKDRCHRIFAGDLQGHGTPLHLLREFLVSDDATLLNRGSDRALAELVLLALQLDVAGDKVDRLELSLAGLHAFRALQPERVAKVAAMFDLTK